MNEIEKADTLEDLATSRSITEALTFTMTHSEKSHICRMKAWPYRQECRGHDPTKKNLLCCWSLLVGKVCVYILLKTVGNASCPEMNSEYTEKKK